MAGNGEKRIFCKITIEGVVQGVGFRPFVFRAAQKYGINGRVTNKGGAVEIFANGETAALDTFFRFLRDDAPLAARITGMEMQAIPPFEANSFAILQSGADQSLSAFPSPDLPVCPDCLSEIYSRTDRRARHYFNSCTGCGPRFSVIRELPYDRARTSMGEFPLCPDCAGEYTSPDTRRFHAETVCCNGCGPTLAYSGGGQRLTGEHAFTTAVDELRRGGIVAIKGVGGYHLACLPGEERAVSALRRLKGRDEKPFAIMFRSIERVRECCDVSDEDATLLLSHPRPITLLPLSGEDTFAPSVLCGDKNCGCFLPYTPLHCLLLDEMNELVMTSANTSGSAIIFSDSDMQKLAAESGGALAGVLSNDREIVRSLEDSVAQVNCGHAQILRRGRGLAPTALELKTAAGRSYLAMGGDLKAAFCLVKNGNAYVSQHFGDLEEQSVFERYCDSIEDYKHLLGIKPEYVLCDAHPGYHSTAYAQSLGLPVYYIQHHFAHAASVLAEQGLDEKAVAVCFDGTGYGEGGQIWGGEFLLCDGARFERAGYLQPVRLLGGDSTASDALKTSACYMLHAGVEFGTDFDPRAPVFKAALDANVNAFEYTGAGRLFDACSAILGLCSENRYEGQCAAALEQAACGALKRGATPPALSFDISSEDGVVSIDTRGIISAACRRECPPDSFALGFHIALAKAVAEVCRSISERAGTKTVVLSGGVFQNRLLSQLVQGGLRERGLHSYMNRRYPPNDSGLALGQAYIGALI